MSRFASLSAACALALLAGTAASAAESEATVSGRALFEGKAPPRKIINTASDPSCRLHKPPRTEEVIVDKDGALSNVVVYVKGGLPAGKAYAAPADPVVIDQSGCRYEPHVAVVRVGQPLKVANSDPTLHNVHGLPFDNPAFNIVQPTQGASNTFTFTAPEAPGFVLKCDVHAWMRSYVWVLDHPWFAVTGKDGSFTLPPLPPGEYTIGAWQESCASLEQQVKLEPGAKVELKFTFKSAKK